MTSYYCHSCHTFIGPTSLLPEFVCPSCHSGFVEETQSSTRPDNEPHRSSDESDDNSEMDSMEFARNPLAQIFGLVGFDPAQIVPRHMGQPQQQQPQQQTTSTTTTTSISTANSDNNSVSHSSSEVPNQMNSGVASQFTISTPTGTATINSRSNRGRSNSASGSGGGPSTHAPGYSLTIDSNQSLADVLHDFLTGVSFGTPQPGAAGGNASRGLINIDVPLPVLNLHSAPGDYAWGNAGFDAVITQLLNNLDSTGSGPPPMPEEQINKLKTVEITTEQVKKQGLQCSICMEDFHVSEEAKQLPCEHCYHPTCITRWLRSHASCPICRKNFIPPSANTASTTSTGPTETSGSQSSNNPGNSRQETTNSANAAVTNSGGEEGGGRRVSSTEVNYETDDDFD